MTPSDAGHHGDDPPDAARDALEAASGPIAGDLTTDALTDVLLHATDMITVIDAAGFCTYASPATVHVSGFQPEDLVGQAGDFLIHPDERDRVWTEATEQILGRAPARPVLYRQVTVEGGYHHVEAIVTRLPEDHPLGTIVISARDVTGRIEAVRAHRNGQNLIRMVAEGRPLEEVLTVLTGFVERAAPGGAAAIMRVDQSAEHLRVGAAPNLPDPFVDHLDGLAVGPANGSCAVAVRLRSPVMVSDIARDPRWDETRDLALASGLHACWSVPVISAGAGPILGTLAVYWAEPKAPTPADTAFLEEAVGLATVALERARIEGELAYRATHDGLTGLPNRALFHDRAEQALARRRRGQLGLVGVLFVDVDGFRAVNAEHGHAAGDQLLVEVGRRLEATVREVDTVARFSGDEFLVLAHTDDTERLAERIIESLREPFAQPADLTVTVSIGVATAADDDTPASLVHRADRALALAKSNGRDRAESVAADVASGADDPR